MKIFQRILPATLFLILVLFIGSCSGDSKDLEDPIITEEDPVESLQLQYENLAEQRFPGDTDLGEITPESVHFVLDTLYTTLRSTVNPVLAYTGIPNFVPVFYYVSEGVDGAFLLPPDVRRAFEDPVLIVSLPLTPPEISGDIPIGQLDSANAPDQNGLQSCEVSGDEGFETLSFGSDKYIINIDFDNCEHSPGLINTGYAQAILERLYRHPLQTISEGDIVFHSQRQFFDDIPIQLFRSAAEGFSRYKMTGYTYTVQTLRSEEVSTSEKSDVKNCVVSDQVWGKPTNFDEDFKHHFLLAGQQDFDTILVSKEAYCNPLESGFFGYVVAPAKGKITFELLDTELSYQLWKGGRKPTAGHLKLTGVNGASAVLQINPLAYILGSPTGDPPAATRIFLDSDGDGVYELVSDVYQNLLELLQADPLTMAFASNTSQSIPPAVYGYPSWETDADGNMAASPGLHFDIDTPEDQLNMIFEWYLKGEKEPIFIGTTLPAGTVAADAKLKLHWIVDDGSTQVRSLPYPPFRTVPLKLPRT